MTLISKSCKIQSPDGSDYCMEIESELNENVLNEQLESACKKRNFFKSIANDLYDSEIIYQKEINFGIEIEMQYFNLFFLAFMKFSFLHNENFIK